MTTMFEKCTKAKFVLKDGQLLRVIAFYHHKGDAPASGPTDPQELGVRFNDDIEEDHKPSLYVEDFQGCDDVLYFDELENLPMYALTLIE
jgi:hypothetical protein